MEIFFIVFGTLIGITLFVFLLKLVFRRDKNFDFKQYQTPVSNSMSDKDVISNVGRLLKDGKTIEAIKLVHKNRNISLSESKNYVEQFAKSNYSANPVYKKIENIIDNGIDDASLSQIKSMLSRGNKIEAIKFVSQSKKLGLKEAKDLVEAIEAHSGRS